MQRRLILIHLAGLATVVWPVRVSAQRPETQVIGLLHPGSAEGDAVNIAGFHKGLSETGFVEGRNIAIEYRWANNDYSRLPELARDLVNRRVAVIAVPGSGQAAFAAKAATNSIPVVFGAAADPIREGLIESFNRPGGNITGITYMGNELIAKRLQLLHELVPNASRFAMLLHPSMLGREAVISDTQGAAAGINRELEIFLVTNSNEIDLAFAKSAQARVDGLLIAPAPLFTSLRQQIITLEKRQALPIIHYNRQFADAGGIMSYAADGVDQSRQVGSYVGRILKGEKPSDMPVMRATKFDFVVNLRAARSMGVVVPTALLAVANEVIE